ncbi:hypothetical protein QFZ57_004332 [Arthrobacter sp. B1I2]|nr:hypothetical protein [Arthrobacter sp. B1I2]
MSTHTQNTASDTRFTFHLGILLGIHYIAALSIVLALLLGGGR